MQVSHIFHNVLFLCLLSFNLFECKEFNGIVARELQRVSKPLQYAYEMKGISKRMIIFFKANDTKHMTEVLKDEDVYNNDLIEYEIIKYLVIFTIISPILIYPKK